MKSNKIVKASIGVIFSLIMAVLVCLPCLAADSADSVVIGYKVTSDTIEKYDVVNITVFVKNFGMSSTDLAENEIYITHCLDSFTCNSEPLVTKLPADNGKLKYSVAFNGCCCKDTAGTFSFIATYGGNEADRETLSFTVAECGAAEPNTGSDPQLPSSTTLPADDPTLPPIITTTAPADDFKEPASEPTSTPAQNPAPLVRITRSDITKKLTAGTEFDLNVTFANTCSPYSISGCVATFEPSEGLVLNENSSSKSIPDIAAKSSKTITVKMKVASAVENAAQSVAVSFRYNYKTAEGIVQGTETEKLNISVISTGTTAAGSQHATPNIIVTKYNYGAEAVAAGDRFNLSLQFKNTSKSLKVENIVMAIDTGEGLSITSSSNTFYFDSLQALQSVSQTVGLGLSANIATVGAKLDITFRYEYVDGGTRSNATCSESLSIPVYIPDRFSVTPPETMFATANEEATISLAYINKSKNSVNNVEAVIEYDEAALYCEIPKQNLGNFESGKNGTIDFFVTPNVEGETAVTITVTYETEMLETKTVKIPLTFTVDPAIDYGFEEPFTDIGEGEQEGNKLPAGAIIAIVIGIIVAVVVVVVVIRKKKKKKATEIPADFDWNVTADSQEQEVKQDETN